jgi:hypothetical protein
MGGVFVREVLAAMDDQQEWMAAVLLFDVAVGKRDAVRRV